MIHHLDLESSNPQLHQSYPSASNNRNYHYGKGTDYAEFERSNHADYYQLLYKYSQTSSCENLCDTSGRQNWGRVNPPKIKKSGLLPRLLPSWFLRKKKNPAKGCPVAPSFAETGGSGTPGNIRNRSFTMQPEQIMGRSGMPVYDSPLEQTTSSGCFPFQHEPEQLTVRSPKVPNRDYSSSRCTNYVHLNPSSSTKPRDRDQTSTGAAANGYCLFGSRSGPAGVALPPAHIKEKSDVTGAHIAPDNDLSRLAKHVDTTCHNDQRQFPPAHQNYQLYPENPGNAATGNNHSVSSSPEHKSSGYATLDTANSLANHAPSRHHHSKSVVSQSKNSSYSYLSPANKERRRPPQLPLKQSDYQSTATNVYNQKPLAPSNYQNRHVANNQAIPATNPNFRVRRNLNSGGGTPNSPKSPICSQNYFDFSAVSIQPEARKFSSNDNYPTITNANHLGFRSESSTPCHRGILKNSRSPLPASRSPIFAEKSKELTTSLSHSTGIPGNAIFEHEYATIASKILRTNDISAQTNNTTLLSKSVSLTNTGFCEKSTQTAELNTFFDSQGTDRRVLRKFQKLTLTQYNSELGSIPSLVEGRPDPGENVITQQDLMANQYANPPMTEFDKSLLVINWLMHCQKELKTNKICFF